MPFPNVPALPSPTLYPGDAGPFTSQILASVSPWDDAQGHWQAFNQALAAPFEQIAGIVLDQGSPDEPNNYVAGWSVLLDPDNCPAQFIPFGALVCGVVIPPGTDEATARAQWKAEAGFKRGSPGAIVAAAQRFLTGTQGCVMLERTAGNGTPDAYHFVLIVHPEEVTSVTDLTNAVNVARPVGVQWTLVQTDSWIWNQATGTWTTDTMSWNATASERP